MGSWASSWVNTSAVASSPNAVTTPSPIWVSTASTLQTGATAQARRVVTASRWGAARSIARLLEEATDPSTWAQ